MTPAMLARLKSDRDWHGFLTLENIGPVTDRIRSMLGNGQRYTWVAVNEGYGWRPEVRASQIAKSVDLARRDLEDGRPWAHLMVSDTYGVWGLHTDAADDAAAHQTDSKQRTYLSIAYRKITIELFAPAGFHMFWVIALEDSEATS